jgi:hypothetical protein
MDFQHQLTETVGGCSARTQNHVTVHQPKKDEVAIDPQSKTFLPSLPPPSFPAAALSLPPMHSQEVSAAFSPQRVFAIDPA